MSLNIEKARFNMVEQQVRPWEVLDARVLDVLTRVPREEFVAPEHRQLAFADLELPLGHGQFTMKPVIEGRILQAILVQPHEQVLQIGTGSGFLAACLGKLAKDVVSVELHEDLAKTARERLQKAGIGNVRIDVAEAVNGYQPANTQFDVIVVTGAVHTLPERFKRWLKPGGRMFAVVGESPVQRAVLVTREGDSYKEESIFETDLAYLANAAPPKRFTL
ncbi:protein-L-isoaspartate O-methyltransferase family protein [Tahibacter amnicola]|uniref:Protein-L-isoaspartate O-methyltransferase n=1 Tax=Tahibacter amnicola TaxID=2976241 RepID=A0ABY6BG78_9GAMM|nr:protein-L-isoaspartate O-methyltransferase [Tahibacter amnicola]UXI69023.1 protein-L-isoaspartate O-methyltransferase [Tahibacter amnicola]